MGRFFMRQKGDFMRADVSLALRADIAASVFCNADYSDIEFLALTPAPKTDEDLEALAPQIQARALRVVGVMGRVNGVPQIAWRDLPQYPSCFSALRAAFLRYCNRLESGDEVEWLEALYALSDTRF
jgi:hypothetical protein